MSTEDFRARLIEYIDREARPPDKFSHQARLYRLAVELAGTRPYDDDVVFAGAWLHDLGVFIGHRPEEPDALVRWDHVAYATKAAPGLLVQFGFPEARIPAVLEVIRTHMPHCEPTSFEGELLRDADILEQLGATGILRVISKVGRDTRFIRFGDALHVLRRNLGELPGKLRLESARARLPERCELLRRFLQQADSETADIPW